MSLRQRLWNGGRSYGPILLSDSPLVAEIMTLAGGPSGGGCGGCGYGHVIIDHEHGPTDVRSGIEMLRGVQAATADILLRRQQQTQSQSQSQSESSALPEPIVRIPGHDPIYMKKVLDTLPLPAGVMVPMVDDAATARAVVQSTRYPLQKHSETSGDDDASSSRSRSNSSIIQQDGIRGCAISVVRASGYGTTASSEYMHRANNDLFVMVQVETIKGVEAIAEIAAVPGVDAIFIGPYDLSCSLGHMGDFDHPKVKEVLHQAEQAILATRNSSTGGCLLAGFRPPGRSIAEMFETGYSLVCGAADVALLQAAARKDAEEGYAAIRSLSSKQSSEEGHKE